MHRMKDRITAYLRIVPSACANMIADDLHLERPAVQKALHQMEDDGTVMMSLGWYRLSEVAKLRLE